MGIEISKCLLKQNGCNVLSYNVLALNMYPRIGLQWIGTTCCFGYPWNWSIMETAAVMLRQHYWCFRVTWCLYRHAAGSSYMVVHINRMSCHHTPDIHSHCH